MNMNIPASKSKSALQLKLEKKLAEIRASSAAKRHGKTIDSIEPPQSSQSTTTSINASIPSQPQAVGTDRFGNTITYNEAQQRAIDLVSSGKSCVVIGAAGTGKTTIQKAATQALVDNGSIVPLNSHHAHLKSSSPGIVICAFTRRATNNIKKNLSEDLQPCCITIHKLLEYQPVEIWIPQEDGTSKRSMRFEPQRTAENPLPATISTIIIEEASMVSLELFELLKAATPHNPQFVFLGDIQQLPPVFGSAILGYKMLELPVVELTEVHRQALDSPILKLAHRILSGKPIPPSQYQPSSVPGKLTLFPWKKQITPHAATQVLAKFFIKAIEEGKYNPDTDGILIPFNKSCGSIELNKHIATKIAEREGKEVFEIIHGFKKSYFSAGDKCLYDREDCTIQEILPNPSYSGVTPKSPSVHMNYWGFKSSAEPMDDQETIDIDHILAATSLPSVDSEEPKTRAASHRIIIYLHDSERTLTLSSAGEVDNLDLGYAITVHKSQGSEWDKVFLCFHHSHNMMMQRELLYTAVTRAKEELFVICEPDTFDRGIIRQRIKGDTWQEKAEFFKGKIEKGIIQS